MKELESRLKYRLYCLRRLAEILPDRQLKTTADGIFMSQIRYALPLWYPTRISQDDPQSGSIQRVEKEFNKCLRLLNKCKLEDKVSINKMLENLEWLSINQLSAEIRLIEAWKGANLEDYCLGETLVKQKKSAYATRSNDVVLFDLGVNDIHGSTGFVNTTARLWNKCPVEIKKASTLDKAKREIRNFVKDNIPM